MSETMKAMVFRRYGSPDVLRLEDVPKPKPKPNEILVKIYAATVATADGETRRFDFPWWFSFPLRLAFGVFRPRKFIQILGQEMAGEVEAVGKKVTKFKPGDEVFVAIAGFGAHAEYKCLSEDSAIAVKPSSMSFEEATTFSVFALNALHFIKKAALKPGDKILINGAGSSIGTPAVQLAKNAGAIGTAVDSDRKLEMLRSIGTDHVIDYAHQDYTRNGERYDVILDVIGKSPYRRSLKSLAPEGRYILANPKGSSMLRSLWTNRGGRKKVLFAFAGESTEGLEYLKSEIEAGNLRAVIDRRYCLADAADAHRYVETDEKIGNVVLTMTDKAAAII